MTTTTTTCATCGATVAEPTFAQRLWRWTAHDGELDSPGMLAAWEREYARWQVLPECKLARRTDWDETTLGAVSDATFGGLLAAACVDWPQGAKRADTLRPYAALELARRLLAGDGQLGPVLDAKLEQFTRVRGLPRLVRWLVQPPDAPTTGDGAHLHLSAIMLWGVVLLHPRAAAEFGRVAPLLRGLVLRALIDAWHSSAMLDDIDPLAIVCARALLSTLHLWPRDGVELLERDAALRGRLRQLCLRAWNARSSDDVESIRVANLQWVATGLADAVLWPTAPLAATAAACTTAEGEALGKPPTLTPTADAKRRPRAAPEIDTEMVGAWLRLLELDLRTRPQPDEFELHGGTAAATTSITKAAHNADGGGGGKRPLREILLTLLLQWSATVEAGALTTALASLDGMPVAPVHVLLAASQEIRRPRIQLLARNVLTQLTPSAVAVARATLDSVRLSCSHCRTYVGPPTTTGTGTHVDACHAARSVCARCRRAAYCGRECQRAHWPLHKPACRESRRSVV